MILYTMIGMYCILLPLLLPSVSTIAKCTNTIRAAYFLLGILGTLLTHTVFSLAIVFVTIVRQENKFTLGLQFWMIGIVLCIIQMCAFVFMYWAFKTKECGTPGEVKMVKMAAALMVVNLVIVAMVGYSTVAQSTSVMGTLDALLKFATRIVFANSEAGRTIAESVDKIIVEKIKESAYNKEREDSVNEILKYTNAYVFKRKLTEYMKTFAAEDDLYNHLSEILNVIGSNSEWIVYKTRKNV